MYALLHMCSLVIIIVMTSMHTYDDYSRCIKVTLAYEMVSVQMTKHQPILKTKLPCILILTTYVYVIVYLDLMMISPLQ